MTNREIGEMIKIRRLSKGMTQGQLAAAVGISESAIAMYEAGKRKPKDPVVEALADVFNVPKWSILYSEDEMTPKGSVPTDEELFEIRESFRKNPDLRVLFDLQRGATREELREIKNYVRFIRKGSDYDDSDTP